MKHPLVLINLAQAVLMTALVLGLGVRLLRALQGAVPQGGERVGEGSLWGGCPHLTCVGLGDKDVCPA